MLHEHVGESGGERMEGDSESLEENYCFKQRLEKSTGAEMILMEWSPVADLLAAAFSNHSVTLSRLSWQRVWNIQPVESAISALAWRPDGRVLAVGREDGLVSLHSVEDGHLLHEFSAGAAITKLHWTQQSEESYKLAEYTKYKEQWKKYLPPLPALDSSHESFTSKNDGEGKHSADPKQLFSHLKTGSLLLIGDEVGRVHLCVSGVLLVASAEINNSSQSGGHVIITNASEDLKLITCLVSAQQADSDELARLCLQSLNTSLISDHSHELQHLALKFGHISSLLEYVSSTLKSMHEAWEDLLLMMDNKLASYASTLPEGRTVSDEFLVLLACGRARSELQTFLVDDLTAKGLKKLGISLEMSYDGIRKFVVDHLNGAVQALHYHLTEVLGMARWSDRFGLLGLSEAAVQESLKQVGIFALKSRELLLAIDDSLKSIKVFFVWLYGVIMKLAGDPLPKGAKDHLTGEELKLITEFLRKRLSKASDEDTQTFSLEVVGQYLEDEDLKYVEERPPSVLEKIIEEAKLDLQDIPWMFLPNRKKSLVQLFHSLHGSIDTLFAMPMTSIQQSFSSSNTTELSSISCNSKPASQVAKWLIPFVGYFVHEGVHYVYQPTVSGSDATAGSRTPSPQPSTSSATSRKEEEFVCENITLSRYGDSEKPLLQCCRFHVCNVPSVQDKEPDQRYQIVSLQYYNEEALSILLRYMPKVDEHSPTPSPSPQTVDSVPNPHHVVAQLPIESLISRLLWDTVGSHDQDSIDVGQILTQVLPLGPFRAASLSVTGSRRLAALLTSNGKKIRLYDVDFEEGDDDD